ncbi:MAG: beta-agarase [Pirellulales bacterium]|nr:beta-agarase [Pirellulales bacterium]
MLLRTAGLVVACAFACVLLTTNHVAAERVLFQFGEDFDLATVQTQDVQLSRHGSALRLATGHAADWPGITLKAPQGHWDLSTCEYLAVDLKNVGTGDVEVFCRVDNPGADGTENCITENLDLRPGEQKVLKVPLKGKMPEGLRSKLFGMRGYPGGWDQNRGIDLGNVTQLLVFVHKPSLDHEFEIAGVRAGGERPAAVPDDDKGVFPLIDAFGQFRHADWPGKTQSPADFAKHEKAEAADLAAHPGPEGWNRYGGWQAGPQLEATGRFRVEKRQGKWWLVDPEGRLFWSHGADCVRWTTGYTPITDREHWFAELPERNSPLGRFSGTSGWAPHGYYQDKGPFDTYNFTGANLLRKYGDDWQRQFAEICHRRLRSWGMNTIANWSDSSIYLMRKTPYTANVGFGSKELEGSQGYWGKFPDVFDPSFVEGVRRGMGGQRDKAAGDPWCIGYFLSNELSWGDELSLAVATLASPPQQEAKRVFLEVLEKKYQTIERLNAAWRTDHASWGAVRNSQQPPDRKRAYDDLAAFYTQTAEQYFRVCREAVKAADPQGLYLGCRFAWANDRAVRAAAKYCDVVSFNKYSDSVADFRFPPGVDKPMVIGEFHFGALDRGMFHTGLRPVADQNARAEAYRSYVRGALANPWIVGTHWFQYGDQATTGRGDGENYQIGLLDVCDTPYPETIEAVRQVGYGMYGDRLKRRDLGANGP